MRLVSIALLLLVVFFGGMTYGSFERDRYTTQTELLEQEVDHVETIVDLEMIERELIHIDKQDQKVHKTASFLEKIVTNLYEFIIQVMYRIANLFFE